MISFYFNKQCTIYILYFNNIYIIITPYMFRYICVILKKLKECTSLKLRSVYISKILLKIIKLNFYVVVDKM
jgi:hypothetical protein